MSWFDVDSAFAEMENLSRQMDALLGYRGLDGRHGLRLFTGNSDHGLFTEEGEDLVWRGDLPGFAREDLSLGVENGVLTLQARRHRPDAIDGKTARFRERRALEVTRSWTLPDAVDVDHISASLEDGVLTVRLPRRPEAKSRQISVA